MGERGDDVATTVGFRIEPPEVVEIGAEESDAHTEVCVVMYGLVKSGFLTCQCVRSGVG